MTKIYFKKILSKIFIENITSYANNKTIKTRHLQRKVTIWELENKKKWKNKTHAIKIYENQK